MKFGTMKPHRRNRLLLALFLVVGAGGATTFALLALNENINLFYSHLNRSFRGRRRRVKLSGPVAWCWLAALCALRPTWA